METRIRKLREDDLGQVAAIESATSAIPWSDKIFKDCFHAGYPGWVIEGDGKIIGFTFITIHSDECHLLNLGVHPQYQRRGYGQQMLQYVLDTVKRQGAVMIYLEVRESNNSAIKLYQKMKFIQISMRKDYYPAYEGRENGLVYALDLTPPPLSL